MPRLREVLETPSSKDILTPNAPVIPVEDKIIEKKYGASPVKTTVDLSLFPYVFNASHRYMYRNVKTFITVGRNGEVYMPKLMAEKIKTGQVEIYLNSVGTIMVVKAVEQNGLPVSNKSGSSGIRVNCIALARKLRELGIDPPKMYEAEWDEEVKAWVGRLRHDDGGKNAT